MQGTGLVSESVKAPVRNSVASLGPSPCPGASPGPSPNPSTVTSLGAFKAVLTHRASQGTHWTLSERVAVEVAYTHCQGRYVQDGAILLASDHPQQAMVRHPINNNLRTPNEQQFENTLSTYP